jgi:hypothetical protein
MLVLGLTDVAVVQRHALGSVHLQLHVSRLSESGRELFGSPTNGTGPSPGLYAMPNRYMLAMVSPIRRLLV